MQAKRRRNIKTESLARGIKFTVMEGDEEIARAYLYILHNSLHEQPFGFLEDVFVQESHARKGIGTKLVRKVIAAAKTARCYKLIATSRFEREHVHKLYKKLGFEEHGVEFRMNF